MGDWSHLPRELLDAIAVLLPSDIDVMRFRSVCTSWRSSVPYPLLYQLPNCFPIHPQTLSSNLISDVGSFYLSRRLVVCVSLPQNEQIRNSTTSSEGWLIKLEQDYPNVLHLLNPLNETLIAPLPTTIPKIIDSMNFQISVLGQEFVLRYANKPPYINQFGPSGDVYMEKVAFSSNPPWGIGQNYVILTIHVSGKLAVFRSVDNSWIIIDDLQCPYDDVICYKGELYAVDSNGRAVTVDSSLTVTDIAPPIHGGDKKCLVESNGELLLVDRYLSLGPDDAPDNDPLEEPVGHYDTDIDNTSIWFRVYKLGESRQWVEVKSLGDLVLFLADNCSFSASAYDLSGCKGSCIYYTDKVFRLDREEDDNAFKTHDLGIFNLESGIIGPFMSHPDHSELFWPPPAWISTQPS